MKRRPAFPVLVEKLHTPTWTLHRCRFRPTAPGLWRCECTMYFAAGLGTTTSPVRARLIRLEPWQRQIDTWLHP